MTADARDRRQRMAALLEEAFDSGALAFSEPLLGGAEAVESEEFRGRVRSEQGVPYEIERKLGHGGMATVYLARDPKHDRPVAIKVLHAELTARVGAERFVREIRLTARLQHPHVLGLLDSGVFDGDAGALAGRSYYVMPYVDGESLRTRLAREGALPVADAVRVLRDVADALSYAHDQGVVHRDIKPDNILLTRGHAVVADFGIAKALAAAQQGEQRWSSGSASATDASEGVTSNDSSTPPMADVTHASTFIGTPGYMAPEQASAGSRVDHRADLYAWGVVAYEILCGRHPFGARHSAAELLPGYTRDMPRPVRDMAPSVPPALGALVMRCLATAPADRPDSAAELLVALDAAAAGTRAEIPSLPGSSRRTWRVAIAVLAVVVLGAGITYVVRRPLSATSSRSPTTLARQAVVVGTGNPAIDVPAVQAAVDHAETVVLQGTFSFRLEPTKPVDPVLASARFASPPAAEVLVSKAVTISGVRDAAGDMATIDAGTVPFYIDAPGARVVVRGLRFVRPTGSAILVRAAHDVGIAANLMEGLQPFVRAGAAIIVNTSGSIPTPSYPGRPEAVSGTVTIGENDIDASGGTAADSRLGIVVWSVGRSPHAEVTLDIIGNKIRNTTSSAIMVRRANGRVRVLGNTVTTSSQVAENGTDAVRLVNSGSYLMAHNTVNCNWPICVGIVVFSQFAEWPIRGAIVEDNQVNMLPPPRTVFADSSAAIEIKGFADSNVVRYNTIRGRARTALGVDTFRGGVPADNAFMDNNVAGLHASVASIVVGSGTLRTRLVHPGTYVDHGEGTRIEDRATKRRVARP